MIQLGLDQVQTLKAPEENKCELMVKETESEAEDIVLGVPFLRGRCVRVDLGAKSLYAYDSVRHG